MNVPSTVYSYSDDIYKSIASIKNIIDFVHGFFIIIRASP